MEITCPSCREVTPAWSLSCTRCGRRLPTLARAVQLWLEPGSGEATLALETPVVRAKAQRPLAARMVNIPVATERVPEVTWVRREPLPPRGKHPVRRRLLIISLVLLVVLLTGLAGGAWYINSRFDQLNALSTPPPEISGDRLGGDKELAIDTDPAREAVRAAERQESVESGNGNEVVAGGDVLGDGNAAAEEPDIAGEGPDGRSDLALASANGGDIPGGAGAVGASLTDGTGGDISSPSGSGSTDPPSAAIAQPNLPSDESITFLMMGVDARPGEAIDIEVRPDSLAVAVLDGEDGSCRILAIPRDTRVELPGYGQSKINHALSVGGIPYQMLVVEQLLGMEIDHYGLIDFAGLTELVDSIGGVTITNGEAFTMEGHEFPAGTLELDGEEALAYSRYRGGADGDFGRQERQQQILRAIIGQGAGLDVVRDVPNLLSAVEGHIRTDLGPTEMIGLAQDFRSSCTAETLETARMDGEVSMMYDDLLQMELSFVLVSEMEVRHKVAWLQG